MLPSNGDPPIAGPVHGDDDPAPSAAANGGGGDPNEQQQDGLALLTASNAAAAPKRRRFRSPPRKPEMGTLWRRLRDDRDLLGLVGSFAPTVRFLAMLETEERAIVRSAYLRGNHGFLHALFYDEVLEEGEPSYGHGTSEEQLDSWLDENPDWEEMCLGPKKKENVGKMLVSKAVVQELYLYKCMNVSWSEGVRDDLRLLDVQRAVILSIGGVGGSDLDILNETQVFDLCNREDIEHEGGLVPITYLNLSTWILSHPAPASMLGSLRVFKRLLEIGKIHPTQTIPYEKDLILGEIVQLPLVWLTLLEADPSYNAFRHLLSVGGVDVNVTNPVKRDQNPLHYCIDNAPVECVEALISYGSVDLDAQDGKGDTALHYATHNFDVVLFTRLLEAGADPSVEDADGFVAFDNASIVLEMDDYTDEQRAKAIEMLKALERFGRAT